MQKRLELLLSYQHNSYGISHELAFTQLILRRPDLMVRDGPLGSSTGQQDHQTILGLEIILYLRLEFLCSLLLRLRTYFLQRNVLIMGRSTYRRFFGTLRGISTVKT